MIVTSGMREVAQLRHARIEGKLIGRNVARKMGRGVTFGGHGLLKIGHVRAQQPGPLRRHDHEIGLTCFTIDEFGRSAGSLRDRRRRCDHEM